MGTLNTLTIYQALNGLKNKEFRVVDLVTDCINQIEKYDDKYKVFITVTKDYALNKAKEIIPNSGHSAFIFNMSLDNEKRTFGPIPYLLEKQYLSLKVQRRQLINCWKLALVDIPEREHLIIL